MENNTMNAKIHLTEAKKQLSQIEAMTRSLGDEPSLEEIETVFRKRDVLVARMKCSESQLAQKDSHWVNNLEKNELDIKPLANESWALLRSVEALDKKIAFLIEGRMAEIKIQLAKLYNSSRATYAYIAQSAYRSVR